jgi:hypothetical protein
LIEANTATEAGVALCVEAQGATRTDAFYCIVSPKSELNAGCRFALNVADFNNLQSGFNNSVALLTLSLGEMAGGEAGVSDGMPSACVTVSAYPLASGYAHCK